MKVSYNWLREFVSFNVTYEELAERLTMAGLEVEGIQIIGDEIKDVIVGDVISVEKHPNADKLSLCKVNVGKEVLEIVCGAPNVRAGQKVPVAMIGAELPGGFKIKKSKIRDVYSHGMICSEKELGLSNEDSKGIMVLPHEVKVGEKFIDELKIKDVILELNVTPNRPDCLSIIGIAREISAILSLPIEAPEIVFEEECDSVNMHISVDNFSEEICPRYTARFISDVIIGESPFWMRQRLQSVGIRSINNIVDITNYVLIEYGHPLHAFDSRFIEGNKINIRNAKKDEIFETLDGVKRTLTEKMLVIADEVKPIALAGVMGGSNSEIKNDSKNIVLESAYFDPSSIRNTSKTLDISSEFSYRFERGTDVNGVVTASNRVLMLIQKIAGGKISKGIIDVYPRQLSKKVVSLRPHKVNTILGTDLSDTEIEDILVRLHFSSGRNENDKIDFMIPTFRVDITREIDLIEEVSRIYGYEKIKTKTPALPLNNNKLPLLKEITNKIKNVLSTSGINEIITYSFGNNEQYNKLCLFQNDKRRNTIKIKNPLAPEQDIMRTMLLPGLMDTINHNINHGNSSLKLFEIGKVFLPEEGFELPYEENYLCIALTGKFSRSWDEAEKQIDFFELKGFIETLMNSLGMEVNFTKITDSTFHPSKSFQISSSNMVLGVGGEIHPDVLEKYKIEQLIFSMEISVDKIVALHEKSEKIVFKPFSAYPSITRDLALLAKDEITYEQIIIAIKDTEKRLIEDVKLFDYYKGKNIAIGYKSMGFRIVFRSKESTLKDEEIDKIINKVLDVLLTKLGVELRK